MDLSDIKQLLDVQGRELKAFETKYEKALMDVQARQGRTALGVGGEQVRPAYELITKDGKRYPALSKEQRVEDYLRGAGAGDEDKNFSLGQHVRDIVLGQKLVSSSALVPTYIGAQIIDDVRAQLSLIQAGAVTIPIDGPTNLARITGDPTVVAHAEGANDITESNPTFAAVALNPGSLAALVPLSLEVVQDSPNLDAALRTSIAAAFALKLDTAGLATILADAAIPDSGSAHDPALWGTATTGTLGAVAAAMALNQPVPDGAIVHPTNFIARHAILESTAGGWLGKPPVLAGMREFPTTSMTVDVSVLGGFRRGVGIALRMGLTAEVVRYGKPTYGMHYLIAVMRAAAVVLQPKALFIQKKVP